MQRGSNLPTVRQMNSAMIREVIYNAGPISRTEVAQRLDLSLPTITNNVLPLINSGILYEFSVPDVQNSKQLGRKPVLLDYVPNFGYYVGVDLGPYNTTLALTNVRGTVFHSAIREFAPPIYDEMVAYLSKNILDFIEQSGIEREKIRGVGVCMPGFIDANRGVILNNMRKDWNGRSLASDLSERVGLPVCLENNVRAKAIGYNMTHEQQNGDPLLYYYISYGVSCALTINHRVLCGAFQGAGEIGHMIVDMDGPVCETCGNRGCLEAVASEKAIRRKCERMMEAGMDTMLQELCSEGEKLTMTAILKAYTCGDRVASIAVNGAIRQIGINIANITNLIGPQTVVVDSRLFESSESQQTVLDVIKKNIFSYEQKKEMEIVFLPHVPLNGAISAAAIAIKELLICAPDIES